MSGRPLKICVFIAAASLSALAQDTVVDREATTRTEPNGRILRILSQPNAKYGVFELKQTDESGKITQWYQHYLDADGKEIISITRQTIGDWKPPYESIQFITHYTYNADGNVLEANEFFGDGSLRHRVLYEYDTNGKWVHGTVYDAAGKRIGGEQTPPQAHLYGEKRKK